MTKNDSLRRYIYVSPSVQYPHSDVRAFQLPVPPMMHICNITILYFCPM